MTQTTCSVLLAVQLLSSNHVSYNGYQECMSMKTRVFVKTPPRGGA